MHGRILSTWSGQRNLLDRRRHGGGTRLGEPVDLDIKERQTYLSKGDVIMISAGISRQSGITV